MEHFQIHAPTQIIFEVALNSAPTDLTEAILQTMIYGVESIARQCPQYVRIQEHRR